jgi:mannose-6-phosphate isomerase
VHSLGKDILAYEVQQPSDLTYRLYDWDRRDISGQKRELQLDKALEAINYSAELPHIINIYDSSTEDYFNIIECKQFTCGFGYLKGLKKQEQKPRILAIKTVLLIGAILKLWAEVFRFLIQELLQ